ncbi:hypothetical protein HN51_053445 [Arachis hypogaea]|uniref:Knottin scorpion toxin-like domain-containing protein n=1 Tax=Arachis hypogaea TaxID=3818 RepID=A0A6B9V463_ARAHY|nr:uncharacterized protein DS421_19g638460 [Arachis hypogaea]
MVKLSLGKHFFLLILVSVVAMRSQVTEGKWCRTEFWLPSICNEKGTSDHDKCLEECDQKYGFMSILGRCNYNSLCSCVYKCVNDDH